VDWDYDLQYDLLTLKLEIITAESACSPNFLSIWMVVVERFNNALSSISLAAMGAPILIFHVEAFLPFDFYQHVFFQNRLVLRLNLYLNLYTL